jgi:hypothetical protein
MIFNRVSDGYDVASCGSLPAPCSEAFLLLIESRALFGPQIKEKYELQGKRIRLIVMGRLMEVSQCCLLLLWVQEKTLLFAMTLLGDVAVLSGVRCG